MTRARVVFETDAGGRTYAQPESASYTARGEAFVWVRTRDSGEITRAFATGEMA